MNNEIMSLDEILKDPYYLEQYEQRIKAMTDESLNTGKPTGEKMEVSNMDEQNLITTTVQAEQTPAAAVSVDMEAINKAAEARAERAAQAVVRDMLKQSGLDDAAIQTMTAEWKSKQISPNETIAQLTKERDDGFAERDAKITGYEQEKILRSYGLTDNEDVEIYGIRINRLISDSKDFEQAAAEYFKAHPAATPMDATTKPPMWGGSGRQVVNPAEKTFNFAFQTVRPIPENKK